MKIACALLAMCACAAAPPLRAQDDPLKSAACGAALADLQTARQAGAANVPALCSAAAGACLGSSAVPTRPSRILQAPVAVPPPQVEVPHRVAPLPPPLLPPPPVSIQRAPLPATCDAGGCWSNDGTHLRYIPPSLVVPGGVCIQQGAAVYCQ